MAQIYIDSYGNYFNTTAEVAKFWGIRTSSVDKYLVGEKNFLFAGRRAKDITDVYFSVVVADSSVLNNPADFDKAVERAEWQARLDRPADDYYN